MLYSIHYWCKQLTAKPPVGGSNNKRVVLAPDYNSCIVIKKDWILGENKKMPYMNRYQVTLHAAFFSQAVDYELK